MFEDTMHELRSQLIMKVMTNHQGTIYNINTPIRHSYKTGQFKECLLLLLTHDFTPNT